MQVAAASITGILKVVAVEGDSGRVVNSWGSPAREREIQRMALHTPDAEAALVAHADGAVRVIDMADGAETASLACGASGGAFVGLQALGTDWALTARAGGCVRVQRLKESGDEEEREEETSAKGTKKGKKQREKGKSSGSGAEEEREREAFEMSLANGLESAVERSGVAAVGGRDIPLQLWDLSTGKKTWAMRNVRHNAVNLPERVWVRATRFLEGSLLATGTHAGAVRIYDPSAQRRPLVTLPLAGRPHTCIEASADGRRLFVADVTGRVSSLCLRTRKEEGVYKAKIVGSVRSLACHSGGETLACVGLDRKLRVFDIESRRLVSELYLKQKLTSCLFLADAPPAPEPAEAEDEDMEAIWKEVGVVSDKKRRAKRRAERAEQESDDGTDGEDDSSGGDDTSDDDDSGDSGSDEEESEEESEDGSEEESEEESQGESGTSEDSETDDSEEEEPQRTVGKRKGPPAARPSKRRRPAA